MRHVFEAGMVYDGKQQTSKVSDGCNESLEKGCFMLRFLDIIPYPVLIIAALLLLLAPFKPMPHVVEKLIMLKEGTLTKPIDIFDLLFHLLPAILLVFKLIRDRANGG